MATKKKSDRERYTELTQKAKSARIYFNSIKHSSSRAKHVNSHHKEMFKIIQDLGRISYRRFGYTPDIETSEKSWRIVNKKRAVRLAQYVARCSDENRNEAGWRFEIEAKVFERFDIEVAWYVKTSNFRA